MLTWTKSTRRWSVSGEVGVHRVTGKGGVERRKLARDVLRE